MRRYGEAVLASGVTDFKVRRLYAQALIELGSFTDAVRVLKQIVKEAGARDLESFEARGLLGRVYKQQYVNAPKDRRARKWLASAIESYKSVYDEDPEQVWHGINAASLLLRASRDGHRARRSGRRPADGEGDPRDAGAPRGEGGRRRQDARRVRLRHQGRGVRRARGLRRCAAARWTSTWRTRRCTRSKCPRRIGSSTRCCSWTNVRRDAIWWSACGRRSSAIAPAARRWWTRRPPRGAATSPACVRCCCASRIPSGTPGAVPDLSIQVRMGTVLSITGSEATIRTLMKDPSVIGVEDSRPAGELECIRSLPFIKVQDEYDGPGGKFSEKGDGALIAIIDDGIDVLHRAFLDDEGRTRILGIWDQRDKSGPPPEGFDFGTFHPQEQIQEWVDRQHRPGRRDVHGAGDVVAQQGRPRHPCRQHRGRSCRRQVRRRRGAGGEDPLRHQRERRIDRLLQRASRRAEVHRSVRARRKGSRSSST